MNDLKCVFTCTKKQMPNTNDNMLCSSENIGFEPSLSDIAMPVDSNPIVETISNIVIIFCILFYLTNRMVELRFKKILFDMCLIM